MQTTDLSRFSKKYAQLPGTYQVDIQVNKKEGFTEKNYIYRQCRATSAATVYGRTTT
ncbi:FimD/PapC N-terminal domain-containing protein [Escherichia coli]|uniref:FimD/PapC N-terminal domain-containing protein n=1 Tax=Escherichia coli TaxID=562 RepID=UPI002035BD28|nr:FimD/PapC N-terminal domain-containing protein [Escherichia coli]